VVGTQYREVYHHNPRQPKRSSARNLVEKEYRQRQAEAEPGRAARRTLEQTETRHADDAPDRARVVISVPARVTLQPPSGCSNDDAHRFLFAAPARHGRSCWASQPAISLDRRDEVPVRGPVGSLRTTLNEQMGW
jgi:hypothetical protein